MYFTKKKQYEKKIDVMRIKYILVCYFYVTRMYQYVPVCRWYVTRTYSYVLRMYRCVTCMLPVVLVWCFSHDLSAARARSSRRFDFDFEMMHGHESRANVMSAKTLHWRSPWCVLTFFLLNRPTRVGSVSSYIYFQVAAAPITASWIACLHGLFFYVFFEDRFVVDSN